MLGTHTRTQRSPTERFDRSTSHQIEAHKQPLGPRHMSGPALLSGLKFIKFTDQSAVQRGACPQPPRTQVRYCAKLRNLFEFARVYMRAHRASAEACSGAAFPRLPALAALLPNDTSLACLPYLRTHTSGRLHPVAFLRFISNACHCLPGVAERLQHTCIRMLPACPAQVVPLVAWLTQHI